MSTISAPLTDSRIMMRRNRLVIACNLGTETTTVPVTGELVLAWDAPTVDDETTELPAHSFAVLRCG